GGGTAGCALARKLSDSGQHSVLLLEAGNIPHPELDVPALASTFLSDPNYAKTYYSVRQQNADLENGGVTAYRVGRTLGGSSSVNSMHFNRGNAASYDKWAEITGDSSWRYDNLLKYFKRSENYTGIFPSDKHGRDGPITVSLPKYVPLLNEWLGAGQFLGYPISDPNGPQRISFCPAEYSKRFGRRVSSYTGYLKPVLGSRRNLKVLLDSEVKKIIFNGKRAIGVQFQRSSTSRFSTRSDVVFARKEIIISAGAIESPALLMRSGIGPKETLENAKIRPVKYLNVGLNLQDHVGVRLDFVINKTSAAFIKERDLNPETLRYYNAVGDGPYSSYGGFGGQAFISTTSQGNLTNTADIQLLYMASPGDPNLYAPRPNIQTADDEVATSVYVIVTNPLSRGILRLNRTDINGSPIIDLRHLTHPEDMLVAIDGNSFIPTSKLVNQTRIEMAMKVFEITPQFQRLGARFPLNQFPECEPFPFRSRSYWECYAKQSSTSYMHASGTCAMGGRNSSSVVDHKLRVIGIGGLRVVDASIMPTITNSNLQAAVYVIAEKASDMILQEWDS
ncbi:Glucose dehydrogenase [FAD, quinone], partial [Orchesella cincta]